MNQTVSAQNLDVTNTSGFNRTFFIGERPVDKPTEGSHAFRSLSRMEVFKLKGNRPNYERDFQNDFNRYNVKHFDKHIKGQTKFDPPMVEKRP